MVERAPRAERFSQNPAGLVLAALILATGLATAPAVGSALAAVVAVAGGVLLVTGSVQRVLRFARPALPMIAVLVVPLWVKSGALPAAFVAVRALATIVASASLLARLAPSDLDAALLSLGAPRAIAATVAGSLRQAGTLGEEGRRLVLARRLRGPLRARDGAALLGAWLTRAGSRAERMELAMHLRGYSPTGARTRRPLAAPDAPLLAVSVLSAVLPHVVGRLWP